MQPLTYDHNKSVKTISFTVITLNGLRLIKCHLFRELWLEHYPWPAWPETPISRSWSKLFRRRTKPEVSTFWKINSKERFFQCLRSVIFYICFNPLSFNVKLLKKFLTPSSKVILSMIQIKLTFLIRNYVVCVSTTVASVAIKKK